mmetsp:Transcript_22694/g.42468  ORF Transcript_22694/g.42468 Transcript_22694/m.42468 type:complete len:304 (-) Transcript_22694:692-1603(-)
MRAVTREYAHWPETRSVANMGLSADAKKEEPQSRHDARAFSGARVSHRSNRKGIRPRSLVPSKNSSQVGFGADRCMDDADFKCSWDRAVSLGSISQNTDGQCGDVVVEMFPGSGLDPLYRLEYLAYSYPDEIQTHDNDYCVATLAADRVQTLATTDEPFFLAVGFAKPHMPWRYPESIRAHFASIPDRFFAPNSDDDFWGEESSSWSKYSNREMKTFKNWKSVSAVDRKRAYYASVAFIDAQVKRVLEALDNSAAKDSTIIVFWGDHGFHLGEMGLWGKKNGIRAGDSRPLCDCSCKRFRPHH